ncbi:MAG: GNAT family N-acetyltransferase, partial [Planctomycetota bacterium]
MPDASEFESAFEVTLRGGGTLRVRLVRDSDLDEIVRFGAAVRRTTEFTSIAEGEDWDGERWTKEIEKGQPGSAGLLLVALDDDEIVGYAGLQTPGKGKSRHVTTLAMMIHERYRGVGLGRALLSRLLGWARARGDILKVELGVMHTNAGGIAL